MHSTLYNGDALQVVPKLEKRYDLIVFDPPADLPFAECVQCLVGCCRPCNQPVAFYGVNPEKIRRRMQSAHVPMEILLPVVHEVSGIVGYVGLHNIPMELYIIEVDTPKGTSSHPTAKHPSWFEDVVYGYSSVLDPFAGEGSVGVVCREYKVNYTGIEIDYNHFRTMLERLKVSNVG